MLLVEKKREQRGVKKGLTTVHVCDDDDEV